MLGEIHILPVSLFAPVRSTNPIPKGWQRKMISSVSPDRLSRACGFFFAGIAAGIAIPAAMLAQSPAARIRSEISSSQMTPVKNSLHPLAQPEFDTGRLAPDMKIDGISIMFNHTVAQDTELNKLIAAQQDPSSPQYHQWLAPEQFAAKFGMAQADLDKVQNWLEQQGFAVDSVARSRNLIRFSGTARQVETAFATEMHTYSVNGVRHFAPSTQLSVPAAIAPTVLAIRNLNDFRPSAHAIYRKNVRPNFTSGQTGAVFFAPGDITTVYNIKPVYSGGYNGTGQKIAVVGQSAVQMSDIENFQNAAALTVKDPTTMLVPGTGSSTLSSGDESESDIDLEWTGAIAPGADIVFVYTGSNVNYSAFDAIQYAVDQKLAPIISSSYGECEAYLDGFSLESAFQQAATQGQTVMAASGDGGSTDCFIGAGTGKPPLSEQQALAVDYPASSPYVTGMGGTGVSQANADYLTSGTAYWEGSNGNDVISSALQYLPEVAWNDDVVSKGCGFADCLSASGGGASKLFTKPSWQTGVTGIPSDGKRDVPDLALYASPNFPGYLYCTSDTSAWSSGQSASCDSGFRDSSSGLLTIAGGTSFAAPVFSGIVALINQKDGYTTGQGLINPTLYKLAADRSTYASAFHDITSGNNDCLGGSPDCASTKGFSAGAGYDQVTGLGSVNVGNLLGAWPANSSTQIATTTSVSAASTSPAINASDTFTVTVTSNTGTTVPTGTISITVDSGKPVTGISLTANGTATYTTSFSTAGNHTVLAAYSGDAAHATSSGLVTVNVPTGSSGSGSFALSSTNVTVTQGNSGVSTITVTPKSGYIGTVLLTFDTSNDNALQNLCGSFPNMDSNGDGTVQITNASPISTQLKLDTNAADCVANGAAREGGLVPLRLLHGAKAHNNAPTGGEDRRAPTAIAFAGLLLAGFFGRHSRKLRTMAGVMALAAVGIGLSACGGISSSLSNPPKGTYTVTVTGQDSSSATIPTETTSFTFVIQ